MNSNIVDDNLLPVSEWLPAFTEWVGAPSPVAMTTEDALCIAGEEAVPIIRRFGALRTHARKSSWTSSFDVCYGSPEVFYLLIIIDVRAVERPQR
jgi:hypothetical protein